MLLSECCQAMQPMCNQNCGRTHRDISLWPLVTFSAFCLYTPIASKLLFASLSCPLHAPFFVSTQEGQDYYHFRKVKGQRGFSPGRLISWPWHSLSTAFSLLQNWRDLLAIAEHEWGNFLWWFGLKEMVWKGESFWPTQHILFPI